MANNLLVTTVVGSYPQPDWLVDREKLASRMPPRVRMRDIWRVPEQFLQQAQEDATRIAIADMERAGIDIITDGEIRRESYSNRFATALEGIDLDNPAEIPTRTGVGTTLVPRVVGRIRRIRPVEVDDVKFLRANTKNKIKITLPGPFTISQQCKNEHYKDEAELAMDYAIAVNAEIKDLKAAGADVIQIDEPWLQAKPEQARAFAVPAIKRALEGVEGTTALHVCFGYAYVAKDKPAVYSVLEQMADSTAQQISIEAAQPKLDLSSLGPLAGKDVIYGVIDLNDPAIETPEKIAERIRAALKVIAPERLIIAPDCGMKYLSRETAFGKLEAMAKGAAIVRRELTGRA
jgi:5-methyltetrahydropteroyltriglutamate--homocysteine methyltransferase